MESYRGNAPKHQKKSHKRNTYKKESRVISVDLTRSDKELCGVKDDAKHYVKHKRE